MAYICKGNDLVCDPCCDFCWFCVYNKIGTPIRCGRKHDNQFHGGCGYCDDFKCREHEPHPGPGPYEIGD